jgi:hypothetical protein
MLIDEQAVLVCAEGPIDITMEESSLVFEVNWPVLQCGREAAS